MLHITLKDVNPEKVKSFDLFLKEMNDLSVLLTVAAGPHIAARYLRKDEAGNEHFLLEESGFQSRFNGVRDGERVKSGLFEMKQEGKKMVEISYSITPQHPASIRVWMDCEGEELAKAELERTFQRDFSHEAYQYMKQPLEQPVEVIANEEVTETEEEDLDAEFVPEENTSDQENLVEEEKEIGTEEVVEEITELSARAKEYIQDKSALLGALNDLCYDFTRGQSTNFGTSALQEETLENGAVVHLLDDHEGEYKVTLRIGELDGLTEVSFFLERETGLIFSVYLSSAGNGAITSPQETAHIVSKKVAHFLF